MRSGHAPQIPEPRTCVVELAFDVSTAEIGYQKRHAFVSVDGTRTDVGFPMRVMIGLSGGTGRGLSRVNVVLESTKTCPVRHYSKIRPMPAAACQWFYEREQCHAVVKPKQGLRLLFVWKGSLPAHPIVQAGQCVQRVPTG